MKNLDSYKKYLEQPLSKAVSLPFETYTSQEVYDYEFKELFINDWVFVASELELPNPGDYKTLTIGTE